MAKNDTYGEPVIMEFPNMVARVFRPILTEEERARRMKAIEAAAIQLLISVEQQKAKN